MGLIVNSHEDAVPVISLSKTPDIIAVYKYAPNTGAPKITRGERTELISFKHSPQNQRVLP